MNHPAGRVDSARRLSAALVDEARLPDMALALRLMALAVAAATGAVLAPPMLHAGLLVAGVLAGAAVSGLGFIVRRRVRIATVVTLVLHETVWALLARATGGVHSPLLAGFLIEIPFAATSAGRRGAMLAAACAVLVLVTPPILGEPFALPFVAAAAGFVGVVTVLTIWVVGILEQDRRALAGAHEALRAHAEGLAAELRDMGDVLDVALVTIDDVGRIARLNPAGERMLGRSAAETLGHPWQAVLDLDRTGRAAVAEAMVDAQSSRGVRMLLERVDGRRTSVQAEIWTTRSPSGRTTHLLLGELDGASDHGGDPLRRLGEATACVAHQFRNSLQALEHLARAQGRATAPGVPAVGEIASAFDSLRELSEDMLSLAGAGNAAEAVSLCDVVATAVLLARRPHVPVRVASSGVHVRVRVRRGALVHALFNLVDNACRFSPAEATVDVTISTRDGSAVVEIRDRGPGVAPGILASRGRAPSTTGHGLGLLAARRFIEAAGGELAIEPSVGGGTVCRVELPQAAEPEVVLT
jgi:PAS domain S-box-containing protein